MSGWVTRRRVVAGVGIAALVAGAAVAATAATGPSAQPAPVAVTARPQTPLTTSTESLGLSTQTRLRLALATGPGAGTDPIGAAADSRDDELFRASATGSNDLPEAARRAYRAAAATMAETSPGCGIPWTLLAGIGRVESDHGRFGGSELGADGVSRPAILGVALDGAGPVAAISDTDGGRYDGDTVWDRAVGPMQFIPSTWATSGRDGDGDGVSDPGDLDDASLAAAAYLCRAGGDLTTVSGLRTAVFAYNHSDYYVDLVLAFKRGYDSGDFTIPTPPAPDVTPTRAVRPATPMTPAAPGVTGDDPATTTKEPEGDTVSEGATDDLSADLGGSDDPEGGKGGKGGKPPKGKGGGKNGGQGGDKPEPAAPTSISGTWAFDAMAGTARVGSQAVDLSRGAGSLDQPSSRDYDGDGGADGPETVRDELTDLTGRRVTVSVTVKRSVYTLTAIGGVAYP